MVVPLASEAVSGCNILILPGDASVLRVLGAACGWPKLTGFGPSGGHSGAPFISMAGLGYAIALALYSAKSGGTENSPVFSSYTQRQTSIHGVFTSSPLHVE